MDEVNKIRKKFFIKGETRGKITKSYRRSWDTVNRIVNMNREDLENRGKRTTRQKIVMTDDVIKAIHNLLDYEEMTGVKKKQRYTAAQIFRELSVQGVYRGSRRRMEEVVRKIKSKRKQSSKATFLPLEFSFCNIGAGNEKGAVENGVGYCRRRFFVGLPSFKSWDSLNELLSSCCLKDINQGVHYKTKEKLSDLFALLQTKLMSLPTQKTWRRYVDAKVDKCQLVTVDHHQYSVPERFVESKVKVSLDHYLDQLSRKPRAFSYAKACKEREFDPKLLEMRDRLSSKYGSSKANKQFIDLLLLQRRWNQKEVVEGVQKALDLGAIDVSAVETILRQKSLSPSWEKQDLQSLMPLSSKGWNFDLSAYRELCQEVAP